MAIVSIRNALEELRERRSKPRDLPLDPFVYSPLQGKDSIRLVVVQGSENRATSMSCCLVDVQSSQVDNLYSAIFYTWEGQTPTEQIEVDGHSMLVTKNCEAALKRFRTEERGRATVLWIESICIDQSAAAVEERNHQVSIMGQIYGGANTTPVWLHHS